ncbi:MAG: hypothetical protein MUD01_14260, partial [Chloroflexaceae bacterium]|nr:hypothetical protein [Chloroflexaceae bacterium]
MQPADSPRFNPVRVLLPLALLLALLAGAAWFSRPDGRLRVLFLATPGDAVLIQTPRGGFVLIDGGSDPTLLAQQLGRHVPFWQRSLEAVVLTRADGKRLPGQVAALARYHAQLALVPAPLLQPAARPGPLADMQAEWRRLAQIGGSPVRVAQPGDQLSLGGATLTVLPNSGGASLALRLDYGAASLMLHPAGDDETDEVLLAGAGPVTALAYPWQRPLGTPLLAAWQPRVVIFTDGYEARKPTLLTTAERE